MFSRILLSACLLAIPACIQVCPQVYAEPHDSWLHSPIIRQPGDFSQPAAHADADRQSWTSSTAEDSNIAMLGSCLWTNVLDSWPDGDFVYCLFTNGVVVLDVVDPTEPKYISSLLLPFRPYRLVKLDWYLYVAGGQSGLLVVDVSDPYGPQVVTSRSTFSSATDVVIDGTLAYVAGYTGSLDIFNVSVPEAPIPVGTWEETDWWNVLGVAVSQGFAYLAARAHGLAVIDVSEPSAPDFVTVVGSLPAAEIAIHDTLAYIARAEYGWSIANIADPENPIPLGTHTASGFPYDIVYRNDTVYLTVDVLGAGTIGGINVFDVSVVTAPQLVGNFLEDGSGAGLFLSGTSAYVSQNFGGLSIIDMTDVTELEKIGHYATPGASEHVHVEGDLAYVADGEGIHIVDISVPETPSVLGYYETPGYAYDVFVKDTVAYVCDCYNGLLILNIGDPSEPTFAGNCSIRDCAYRVLVIDSLAYVCHNEYDGGLQLVNVSDPANPVSLGDYWPTSFTLYDVAVTGEIAYVANGIDGILILDVSDPMSPESLGVFDMGGYSYAHGFFVSGDMLCVAQGDSGLQLLDVSNPAEPAALASYSEGMYWSLDVQGWGTTAYVVDGSGVHGIDVSDPANPAAVGYYQTPGVAHEIFVMRRILYVSDAYSVFILGDEHDWICGDCDANGGADIDDVVYLINYIFFSGPPPYPLESGDSNCSGGVDIDDAVYLIAYIFSGGYAPCDTNGDGEPDC